MKKIISLLLVFACLFALASCNDNKKDDNEPAIYAIMKNEKTPTKINTSISYKGTMDGEPFELKGFFEQSVEGENSIFEFSYDRFATIEEGLAMETPEPIVTEKGAVYYRDGKTSFDGKKWDPTSPAAVSLDVKKFNLDKSLFVNPQLDYSGKTVTATVTRENVENVLGTALDVKEGTDLTIMVTVDEVTMRKITVEYETPDGANVVVTSTYSYNLITLEFPA